MSRSFFGYVWRFNALAIAAVSAITFFVGSYAAFQIARDLFHRPYQTSNAARVDADPANPPRSNTELSINPFSPIRGTDTLWAVISATQSYDYRYSSKEASSTRNFVFYDVKSGQSRKLLPADQSLILEHRELRDGDHQSDKAPKALLFTIIEKDTNGDGVLNTQDGAAVALARPNGEGLTRIEGANGAFKGEVYVAAANEVIIMREQQGELKALHVGLDDFKVTRTSAIAR